MNNTINFGVACIIMGLFFILGICVCLTCLNPSEIRQNLCKQLYTTTKDYTDCSQSNHTLNEIIGREQPIK